MPSDSHPARPRGRVSELRTAFGRCSSSGTGAHDAKPRILVLVPTYRPGYKGGGPVASVESLVERLRDAAALTIATADRDVGEQSRYPDLPVDGHIVRQAVHLFYLPPGFAGWVQVTRLLRGQPCDLVYLNDMFSRKWGLWAVLLHRLNCLGGRPLLVAPRNQLSSGALSVKRWRKAAFLLAAQAIRLWKGVKWHATNEDERAEILRWAGAQAVTWTVPEFSNQNVASRVVVKAPPDGGPLLVSFLSRISPKKNLDVALSVLAGVAFPVQFDIAGPVDDAAYWKRLRRLIASMPDHVTVNYLGPVKPNEVRELLASYHGMLFPTRGENFGHVILEALAAGCPPIISDRTPWKDLREKGCGWVVPLDDEDGYRKVLAELNGMTPAAREQMRTAARAYATSYAENATSPAMSLKMFREAADIC